MLPLAPAPQARTLDLRVPMLSAPPKLLFTRNCSSFQHDCDKKYPEKWSWINPMVFWCCYCSLPALHKSPASTKPAMWIPWRELPQALHDCNYRNTTIYTQIGSTTLSRISLTWLSPLNCCHTFLVGPVWKTAPMVRVMESFNISETSLLIVFQVIYVSRNPKDVMVSYYHFSKYMSAVEEVADFNLFMERFLAGKGRISFLLRSPNPIPWPQIE